MHAYLNVLRTGPTLGKVISVSHIVLHCTECAICILSFQTMSRQLQCRKPSLHSPGPRVSAANIQDLVPARNTSCQQPAPFIHRPGQHRSCFTRSRNPSKKSPKHLHSSSVAQFALLRRPSGTKLEPQPTAGQSRFAPLPICCAHLEELKAPYCGFRSPEVS